MHILVLMGSGLGKLLSGAWAWGFVVWGLGLGILSGAACCHPQPTPVHPQPTPVHPQASALHAQHRGVSTRSRPEPIPSPNGNGNEKQQRQMATKNS